MYPSESIVDTVLHELGEYPYASNPPRYIKYLPARISRVQPESMRDVGWIFARQKDMRATQRAATVAAFAAIGASLKGHSN